MVFTIEPFLISWLQFWNNYRYKTTRRLKIEKKELTIGEVRSTINSQSHPISCWRQSYLNRDEETLIVAKAEVEASCGHGQDKDQFSSLINGIVNQVPVTMWKQHKPRSQEEYAHRLLLCVNQVEDKMKG